MSLVDSLDDSDSAQGIGVSGCDDFRGLCDRSIGLNDEVLPVNSRSNRRRSGGVDAEGFKRNRNNCI